MEREERPGPFQGNQPDLKYMLPLCDYSMKTKQNNLKGKVWITKIGKVFLHLQNVNQDNLQHGHDYSSIYRQNVDRLTEVSCGW